MCRLYWNLGASTSRNPLGLSRPVMGLLYLYCRRHVSSAAMMKSKTCRSCLQLQNDLPAKRDCANRVFLLQKSRLADVQLLWQRSNGNLTTVLQRSRNCSVLAFGERAWWTDGRISHHLPLSPVLTPFKYTCMRQRFINYTCCTNRSTFHWPISQASHKT